MQVDIITVSCNVAQRRTRQIIGMSWATQLTTAQLIEWHINASLRLKQLLLLTEIRFHQKTTVRKEDFTKHVLLALNWVHGRHRFSPSLPSWARANAELNRGKTNIIEIGERSSIRASYKTNM